MPELLIVKSKTTVWLMSGTSVAGVNVSTTDMGRLMAELAIWYDTTVVLLQLSSLMWILEGIMPLLKSMLISATVLLRDGLVI